MLPLKKWKIINSDENKPVIEAILTNRNLTADHLDDFRLSERLHDPYLGENGLSMHRDRMGESRLRKEIWRFRSRDVCLGADGFLSGQESRCLCP